MECNRVSLLQSYFDFMYSKEISTAMRAVFVQMCSGCFNGCLSQSEHSCLTLTDKEQLELYFDEIVSCVDEENVLLKWSEAVSGLTGISSSIIEMFKLKIGCKDWRATAMKNNAWKRRMVNMVLRVKNYERLFTDGNSGSDFS